MVSEPLRDLPGAWNEVPESSWGVVRAGDDELQPFSPPGHPCRRVDALLRGGRLGSCPLTTARPDGSPATSSTERWRS